MAKQRVASTNDVREGCIHGVEVGGVELVLVKANGKIRALSGRCPHHDAPLADGLLEGTHLLCPWHQSVFDVTDGALLEPPALDCLASYELEVDGEDVLVELPDQEEGPARAHEMRSEDRADDRRTVVIAGGGAAGLAAAQELRWAGFLGRVVMISDDPYAPYDRTNCSKDYLAGEAPAEWLPLKPPSFYTDAGIERIEHHLDSIDVVNRRVTLPGGEAIEADGLLLATGGEPRRLEEEGAALEGVMTLRSRTDSERLAERADSNGDVVVVGASFIGMEVAASLKQRGVETVTVVAPEEVPFQHTLGARVGELFRRVHAANGVRLSLGRHVERFEGSGGAVRTVVLDGGETLDCGLVVTGVGVRPRTDSIEGVELEDDGSVLVDEMLRVRDGVYAAGDIATFPDWRTGEPTRIEHWRTAQQQGMVAARNLAGEARPFRAVPFFWTMQFGAALGYVGHARHWDEEVVHGDVDGHDFMVYYVRDGRVVAAAAMGRDRQLSALHQLMAQGRDTDAETVRGRDLDLVKLLGS